MQCIYITVYSIPVLYTVQYVDLMNTKNNPILLYLLIAYLIKKGVKNSTAANISQTMQAIDF
jgi:hypothetical protein